MGGKKLKRDQSHQKTNDAGIAFKPMVFESLGGWDSEVVTLIKKIARHCQK